MVEIVSKAKSTFDISIKDAEELLAYCNSLGDPLPQKAEVFKRAGLVMALTAWETYVEDRIVEAVRQRSSVDTHAERFMFAKLEDELKRFHNPTSEKTRKLFLDYLEIDVSAGWRWSGVDPVMAREKLDALVKKSGDAVHRSKVLVAGSPQPHLVTKDHLKKSIRFIRELVDATEKALDKAK